MYDRNTFKNNSYDKTSIFSNANKYLNFKTQKQDLRNNIMCGNGTLFSLGILCGVLKIIYENALFVVNLNALFITLDLPLHCAYDVRGLEHEHKRNEIA